MAYIYSSAKNKQSYNEEIAMHAAPSFYSSGSKVSKIAVVAGLHVAVAVALINLKVLVPAAPPSVIDIVPTRPVTPEQPDPVSSHSAANAEAPVIVVPRLDTVVIEAPVPDAVTAKVDTGQVPAVVAGAGKAAGDGAGSGGAMAPVKKPAAFQAALANASDCALPDYPPRSLRNGDTGTVTLALLIGPNGHVAESKVQRSSGHPELDRAAVSALSMCKFKAASTNGVPEAAWGQIAYVWSLD